MSINEITDIPTLYILLEEAVKSDNVKLIYKISSKITQLSQDRCIEQLYEGIKPDNSTRR